METMRSEEWSEKRSLPELDAGLILKILVCCSVVGGLVFYLGLSVGKGELLGKAEGAVNNDFVELSQRVKQVKAQNSLTSRGEDYLVFPSLLRRQAGDGHEGDDIINSLKRLLPATLKSHEKELAVFEQEKAFEVLLRKKALTYDDIDNSLLPAGKKQEFKGKVANTISRISARSGVPAAEPPVEAPVAAETVATEAPQVPEQAPALKGEKPVFGKYTVQLQAFPTAKEAEQFQNAMKKRNYHTFIQKADLAEKGVWYRVRIGRFKSLAEAQKFKDRFEVKQGFVTQLQSLGEER